MRRITLNAKYAYIDNQLAAKREERGWTVSYAAERVGEARGTYATLEAGYSLPSWPILQKICKVYKCEPRDLYEAMFVTRIQAQYMAMESIIKEREEKELEENDAGTVEAVP